MPDDDIRFFPCLGFTDAAIAALAAAQAQDQGERGSAAWWGAMSLALQVYRALERDYLDKDMLHPSTTASIDINTPAGTMHCSVQDGVVTPAAFTPHPG